MIFRPLPGFRAVFGLLLSALTASNGYGGQVFWTLGHFGKHTQSNGQELSAQTRFQLGVFTAGFIPTLANLADWSTHWRCWREVEFDPAAGGFSEEVIFDENPPPFHENAPLYCWAWVPQSASQSEYFLATDSSWKTPGTDPLAFPVDVNPETAGTVIAGVARPGAGTISTAPVPTGSCPPFLFVDWLREYFDLAQRGNAAVAGPDADPDQDGRSNLMEYLTGTTPDSADSSSLLKIAAAGDGSLSLSFPSPASARANWTFEKSSSLSQWTDDTTTALYEPLAGWWKVPVPTGDRLGFRRLKVISPVAP